MTRDDLSCFIKSAYLIARGHPSSGFSATSFSPIRISVHLSNLAVNPYLFSVAYPHAVPEGNFAFGRSMHHVRSDNYD
jgi:hypothetical protein